MGRLVTIAMAVYSQPLMLEVQFNYLRSYSKELLAQMELLIVDDCGKIPAEIPADIQELLPCQLFRVLDDIAWNQPGARNLALEHVRTPLVLFVDPDMGFSANMMAKMIVAGYELERGHVIRFMLRHRNTQKVDPSSPNTWFLHVADFLAVGAYSEDYSGAKGWSDVSLLDVMKHHYKIHHRSDLFAEFYSADEVSDAMVMSLDRSTVRNKKIRLRDVKMARMNGGWARWVKTCKGPNLRFRWERVLPPTA